MNLYEIVFKHYAPKDSESGIIGYILKESDEDVMRFLSTEYPELNGKRLWTKFYDIDGSTYEKILECKGSINYDDWYIDDLYYGATTYGWNLIKEDISDEEVKVLVGLGILK